MSPPVPTPRQRGFTLVELLISLVVVAFMTAGAMALLGSQQRAFQNTSAERALQETARAALTEMGENLRRAGYGIEPYYAFDFGPLNITATTPNIVSQSYQCASAVTCRDQINGADEIVFHARDPAFGRSLSSAPTTSTLTIVGGLQTPLYQGQILQVMCPGAADWAYVTVATVVPANWAPPAAPPATTTIGLAAGVAGNPFPAQNAKLTGTCFIAGTPSDIRVLKVDRFRYYLARFADPETPAGRPYLMLDRGLTDASGNLLVEPVAPDVEDLQFSYVFPNATAGPATVGATLGTALANSAASIDLGAVPPLFNDPDDIPTRGNQSPANIRAVRVSLVTRTPGQDIRLGNIAVNGALQSSVDATGAGNLVPGSGNRGDWAGDSYHHRLRMETTEATRNLDTRVPYYPAYSTNSGADGLNVGGG